jgi:hypothetical protein
MFPPLFMKHIQGQMALCRFIRNHIACLSKGKHEYDNLDLYVMNGRIGCA